MELVTALAITVFLGAGLFGGCLLAIRRLWRGVGPVDLSLATITLGISVLSVGLPILSGFSAIDRMGLSLMSGSVLLVGAALWMRAPRPNPLPTMAELAPVPLGATALLGLGLWGGIYYLLRGLVLPVETVSDAPIYHLYFAARWWQAHSLVLVATPFGEEAATYFPANGELWLTWLWTAMGSEKLAKVGQWPFLWSSALALYAIAQRFSTPTAALVPTVFWSSTFLSLYSSSLANVDLLFCSSYLTAIYFLIRCMDHEGAAPLVLAGLAAGLALGTKTIGLIYVSLLLPCFLWHTVPRPGARDSSPLRAAIVLLAILVPSAYWYGRNTWLTGNPLYPLAIRIFDIEVLPGWYDRASMLRSGYHVAVTNGWYLLSRLSTVLDLRLMLLWPVAFLAAIVVVPRQRLPIGLCLVGIVLAASYWYIIPYNTQERFLLAPLALLIAPLSLVVDRWKWTIWPMAVLLAWHLLTPSWLFAEKVLQTTGVVTLPLVRNPLTQGQLPSTLILPVGVALAIWLLRRPNGGRVSLAGVTITTAAIASAWPLVSLLRQQPILAHYPATDFGVRLLPAWQVLENVSSPNGQDIAYAGTNLPYYLLGSKLKHRVHYINTSGSADWPPHEFAFRRRVQGLTGLALLPWPQWSRENPDLNAWLENLREERIELLFVARENQHARPDAARVPPFPIEYHWAQSHPDQFERLGPPADPNGGEPWAIVYRRRTPE